MLWEHAFATVIFQSFDYATLCAGAPSRFCNSDGVRGKRVMAVLLIVVDKLLFKCHGLGCVGSLLANSANSLNLILALRLHLLSKALPSRRSILKHFRLLAEDRLRSILIASRPLKYLR